MIKKDIGKVVSKGSIKQRLLLVAENTAREIYGEDLLLSKKDFNTLSNSFKTTRERKLWNEFKSYSESVNTGIMNLQGLKFEVLMNYSNLRGYILVWNSTENAEIMVNKILHEIKDKQERIRIAKEGTKEGGIIFTNSTTDQEGYIDIQIDFEKNSYKDENGERISFKDEPRKSKEYSLLNVMNNVKKETENTLIKYLSWEKALLDFMEDTGFNVETYKEKIIGMTQDISTPVVGWAKYYGAMNTGLPHKRLDKIIEQYAICPELSDIEIDKEQYRFFRYEIIGDNEQ